MNPTQTLGLGLGLTIVAIGVVLLGFGLGSTEAPLDHILNSPTDEYTDMTMWNLAGGVIVLALGSLCVALRN